MMIRLTRWFIGYVVFLFYGGFNEKFLNFCHKNGVPIYDISATENGIEAKINADSYLILKKAAKECGGEIKVLKKRGRPFVFRSLKGRYGLLIGVVISVFMFSFATSFIWNIEIKGCKTISEQSVIDFLETQNVREGMFKKNVDNYKISTNAMANFDDISWIHINVSGTTAVVEIHERKKEPKLQNKEISNIRAKKGGKIIDVLCIRGEPVVQKNFVVTKGDLLISGIYPTENDKKNNFVSANGVVTALVDEKLSQNIQRKQAENKLLKTKKEKSLLFFGLEIPLNFVKKEPNSKESEKTEKLKLNKKELPIGIKTKTIEVYEKTEKILTDDELYELGKEKEKQKQLVKALEKLGEVKSQKTNFQLNENGLTVEIKAKVVENIAYSEKIKAKPSEDKNESKTDDSVKK